ncbi:hypothetical protein CEE39_02025 [bacterium (candidate division B38) B3_B38]|nr:MAG: hypothetical protein CEE39_02025 [bacterium (candidate division B38) B3_B38]
MVSKALFRWAGWCAIIFGVLGLAAYITHSAALGFSSGTPSIPGGLMEIYGRGGIRAGHLLEYISLFFLLPALIGMALFLKKRSPGRAVVGLGFGLVYLIGVFLLSAMTGKIINMVSNPGRMVDEAFKAQVALLNLVGESIFYPLLGMGFLFFILWGLAFRRGNMAERWVGSIFILQAAMVALTFLFFALQMNTLANVGILLQTVITTAAFIMSGILLLEASP